MAQLSIKKTLAKILPSLAEVLPSIDYSTTEKKIGTWIDGKPIYRKALNPYSTKNYAANEVNTINIGVNIDTLIRFDVMTVGNSSANREVNKYVIPGRYTKSSQTVTIEATTNYGTNATYVILEYTKA